MEDLISLSETIAQASTLLADGVPGEDSSRNSSFLKVVTIGSLGSGKSAVLNSLIGHPALPTAEGGATRFPLTIDIERNIHVGDGVRGRMGSNTNLQSAAEIRRAVQADMKRWVPTTSRSAEDRFLKLQSKNAPPLRLVDLPGLENRSSESDNVIFDHAGGDAIILVVIPAPSATDASSARILKLVQNLDQDGSRTVGVITKLDLVGDDQAAVAATIDLLTGKGPPITQDYPWVAVIGQPPNDRTSSEKIRDTLEDSWKAEIATLGVVLRSNGARGMEPKLGREGLVRTIARQVRKRMKERIPRILSGLESRSQDVEDELLRLGDSVLATQEGARAVALELCRGFDTKFVESIEGGEGGGAKMVEKFVGALPGRFRALPLDRLFSMDNVKRVTTEADGYQPYLTSPEKGLRLLIKRSLDSAKDPGLQCVDEVHKILLEVVTASSNAAPSLVRFPPLKREIVAIASMTIEEYRTEAKVMVSSLVDMERVFIPPGHFIDAAARRYEVMKREEELARKREMDRSGSKRGGGDASSEDAKQPGRLSAAMSSLRGKSSAPPPPPPPPPPPGPVQELAGYLWKVSSKNGWSKRWFALSDKTARLYYVKKPDEKTPRGVIPLEDCVVDDIVPVEDFPAVPSGVTDPLRGSGASGGPQNLAQALVFRITNKVPYKTVVKVHHNLVLRTDNLAEKQLWVARIRALTRAEKEQQTDGNAAQQEEDGGGSRNPTPPRSADGPPPPPEEVKSFKRAPISPEEELKYMALEVREYVEAVLGQLSANIPKAIVLTQVERVKDSMLTKLYTSISKLSNDQISQLLAEDPDSKGKREKAQKQQVALASLKRMLSLHEAKASAEDANAGPTTKESPVMEDWRIAFQQAGGSSSISDEPEPPPRPSRFSRKSTAADQSNGPSQSNGSDKRGGGGSSRPIREAPAPPPVSNAPLPRQSSPMRQPSPNRGPPSAPAESSQVPPPQPGPPIGRRPRLPPPPPSAGGGGGGFLKF